MQLHCYHMASASARLTWQISCSKIMHAGAIAYCRLPGTAVRVADAWSELLGTPEVLSSRTCPGMHAAYLLLMAPTAEPAAAATAAMPSDANVVRPECCAGACAACTASIIVCRACQDPIVGGKGLGRAYSVWGTTSPAEDAKHQHKYATCMGLQIIRPRTSRSMQSMLHGRQGARRWQAHIDGRPQIIEALGAQGVGCALGHPGH